MQGRALFGGWFGRGLILGTMMLAGLSPSVLAGSFPTRCVQERTPLLDAINYSLYVTVPSAGYRLSLVRTRVRGDVVRIAVRARLAPGVHAQALETHRVRFTLIAPDFPTRYAVAFNGGKARRPEPIVVLRFTR